MLAINLKVNFLEILSFVTPVPNAQVPRNLVSQPQDGNTTIFSFRPDMFQSLANGLPDIVIITCTFS